MLGLQKLTFESQLLQKLGFESQFLGFGPIRVNPSNPSRPQILASNFLFWNEIFVLGFFGFSCSFERFFAKTLPEPGFFLEWGHSCFFLAFEVKGGGVLPGLLDFFEFPQF